MPAADMVLVYGGEGGSLTRNAWQGGSLAGVIGKIIYDRRNPGSSDEYLRLFARKWLEMAIYLVGAGPLAGWARQAKGRQFMASQY